jgi:hypothetical protein
MLYVSVCTRAICSAWDIALLCCDIVLLECLTLTINHEVPGVATI